MRDISRKIAKILPQISDILNRIPREVLLILKTNDLLRGLSYKLKVPNSPCTFSSASLACTRATYQDKLDHTKSLWKLLTYLVQLYWTLAKIKCYEMYLTAFPSRNPLVMWFYPNLFFKFICFVNTVFSLFKFRLCFWDTFLTRLMK